MTDSEIIKALEMCSSENEAACRNCPQYVKCTSGCIAELMKFALDLIKRQQAEIDRLTVELQAMRGAANSYKAEVERLKKETEQFANVGKLYSEVKAEAIKEFAERLKANRPHLNTGEQVFYIRPEAVDDLVKEMIGGADNA